MSDIQDFLIPVVELVGVMISAIILVSILVGAMVAVLRRFVVSGTLGSYRTLIALRILIGYRRTESGFMVRLIPVSGQNFIAMVGIAIGVWALVVVLSVMGGFEADLKGKIVRHSPHMTVRTGGVPGERVIGHDDVESIAGADHVTTAEAFIEGEAMVTSLTNMSPGMKIHGVEPKGELTRLWLDPVASRETMEGFVAPFLVMSDREMGFATRTRVEVDGDGVQEHEGRADVEIMPPIPSGTGSVGRVMSGIILGEEMARSLSVGVGDRVTVVVPNGDIGPMGVRPRTRSFRVVGTFMSGMYEYDLKMAYLTTEDAKGLFVLDGPNRMAVMIDDLDNLDGAFASVGKKADAAGLGQVRTVAQDNRSLFSALKIEKLAMFMVLGLVILVAAFNVFGSLVLITLEKTRDIAVIRCLGATRGGIRTVFLTIGGTIGLVGTVAGLALGLGTCAYVASTGIRLPSEYYLRTLPVQTRPDEVLLVVLAALGAALLATLYPAKAAAGLSPSEGLRND